MFNIFHKCSTFFTSVQHFFPKWLTFFRFGFKVDLLFNYAQFQSRRQCGLKLIQIAFLYICNILRYVLLMHGYRQHSLILVPKLTFFVTFGSHQGDHEYRRIHSCGLRMLSCTNQIFHSIFERWSLYIGSLPGPLYFIV